MAPNKGAELTAYSARSSLAPASGRSSRLALGGRAVGIEVQLRDERGQILQEVSDHRNVLSQATANVLSGTRLLKYLVPWGDAIFNQAQANDLLDDIRLIKNARPGAPLADLLSDIEPLVEQLARDVHSYLWFVGD